MINDKSSWKMTKYPKHLTQSKNTDKNGKADYNIWLYTSESEKEHIKTMKNTTYTEVVKEIDRLDHTRELETEAAFVGARSGMWAAKKYIEDKIRFGKQADKEIWKNILSKWNQK